MRSDKSKKKTARADMREIDGRDSGSISGGRIAPAVALLLLGDSVAADEDFQPVVSEPSTLALLATGAVVGGAVSYVNRRRKR